METIRPTDADPIPARRSSPRIGSIIVRFTGLLMVAVALLAWAWSR